jgi:integrase
MGNLKGGNFNKQIKNALIRLDARGEKRYGTDSRRTHSNALAKKREMYLKDFKEYLEKKGITEGKLNTLVTESNITEFLNNRLENLSPKTALDYVTGFSSMLKGLEQTRVNISREAYGVLREYTSDYRAEFNAVKDNYETGRAIQDTQAFISNLQEIRESSATIAQLQLETGLRASEALEVAKNFSSYYNEQNSTLEGVIGKGGQEYPAKEISPELAHKLQNLQETPSYSSYYRDIANLEHKTHDLRITYTKELYESLKEQGYSHKEALKEVSTQINHHREAITLYYLARG